MTDTPEASDLERAGELVGHWALGPRGAQSKMDRLVELIAIACAEARAAGVAEGRAANAPAPADTGKAEAALKVAIEALTEIAAFDDTRANVKMTATGSYGSFDEPEAVKAARAALARIEEGELS